MSYDWLSYYKSAYEKQKRRNTALAGRVADAENQQAFLAEKLQRICNNPCYRMTKPLRLAKSVLHRAKAVLHRERAILGQAKNHRGKVNVSGHEDEKQALHKQYMEKLQLQKDSYGQWIREKETIPENGIGTVENGTGTVENGIGNVENGTGTVECVVVPYADVPFWGKNSQGEKGFQAQTENSSHMDTQAGRRIYLFAENPEYLDSSAESYVKSYFERHPETKILYGGEDQIVEGKRVKPWFKPCWSPDTLLGFFYFGSYFAVDEELVKQVLLEDKCSCLEKMETAKEVRDAIRKRSEGQKEDYRGCLYQFVLQLTKDFWVEDRRSNETGSDSEKNTRGKSGQPTICVTDRVLYHTLISQSTDPEKNPEKNPETSSEDAPQDLYFLTSGETRPEDHPEFWGFEKCYLEVKKRFLEEYLKEKGYGQGQGQGLTFVPYQTYSPQVWTVVPECENYGMVSVVIPSKDHPELLKQCIGSVLEKTNPKHRDKRQLEFIVVDNGSCEEKKAEIEALLAGFREKYELTITYLYEPMEFNFSAMCNRGVQASQGEFVLLLNDDIEILEKNWLGIMIGQVLLPGTGAVGAKLWYPDGEKIQHAGITNMQIGPSHKLVTFPDDRSYYYGHNSLPYDMIAVTAACLLVRKEIYQEVGGLDESMKVAYNDVDFCFKVYEAGYRNVQRNDAVLCHHESVSRGLDEGSEEKWDRLLTEKAGLYGKHPTLRSYDPYYSGELAQNAPDYRIGYLHPFEQPFLTTKPVWEKDLAFLKKHASEAVMLTVERAGKQNKLHQDEPDVLFMEGWCYLLGGENSQYERWVILEGREGYARLEVQDRNRPDVTAILPDEKEIELSGFTCRILKEDLISEKTYRVGMLYRSLLDGTYYYKASQKNLNLS